MLEETESLLNNQNNHQDNHQDNQTEIKKGFFRSILYYLRQPTRWDWCIVGIIIVSVVVTIILVL
jgi:hypothetical protein